MVTVKDLATQVEGMENRLVSLHSEFRQELDGINFTVQQLNPKELAVGMAKISHLENTVCALDEGIQEIKHLLLEKGKTPVSSSAAANYSGPSETSSRRLRDGVGRTSRVEPQPISLVSEHLPRRLELSIFEGSDPDGWIFRVERYFEINSLRADEKLRAVLVCMEGKALAWYNWEEGHHLFNGWEEFKERLLLQFRSSQDGNLHEQLMSLLQTSTVQEYQRQFEMLSAPLRELPPSVLEAAFVNGLRPDIQAELRQLDPTGLVGKMRATRRIEEKQRTLEAYHAGTLPRWPKTSFPSQRATHVTVVPTAHRTAQPLPPITATYQSRWDSRAPAPPSKLPSPALTRLHTPFKRLTDREMQEKRERGLCFRCDERFSPGHRCKQKTPQVLWVTDDEEEDGIDPPLPDEAAGGVELADGPTTAVLCISSMVGFCPPHSMKVCGKIKAREVIVLINSGASHNFISEHIMSELQLRCDPIQKFGVQMGNGDEVKTSRVCRGLCLQLAEIEVMADFFPLKLGTSNVVLGFQ